MIHSIKQYIAVATCLPLLACAGKMQFGTLGSPADVVVNGPRADPQGPVIVAPTAKGGPVTAILHAFLEDGSPAPGVAILAIDEEDRIIDFSTDAKGQSRQIVFTPKFKSWKARAKDGRWFPIVAPRIYNEDFSNGFRIALELVPIGQ